VFLLEFGGIVGFHSRLLSPAWALGRHGSIIRERWYQCRSIVAGGSLGAALRDWLIHGCRADKFKDKVAKNGGAAVASSRHAASGEAFVAKWGVLASSSAAFGRCVPVSCLVAGAIFQKCRIGASRSAHSRRRLVLWPARCWPVGDVYPRKRFVLGMWGGRFR